MTDTASLLARIESINAEATLWVSQGEGRFAGMLTTDLAHWADYNVFTAEDLDIYLAATNVYEFTRSVHGYKPNWGALRSMTLEQLNKEMESLQKCADLAHDENEVIYADPNPSFWEELEAQEKWCNPLGELEFMEGHWRIPA